MMILQLLLLRQNRFSVVCLLLGLLGFGAFSCESAPPPDVTDPGQRLFLGYTKKEVNCSKCHAQDAKGGDDAPGLTRVLQKYDEDKVAEIIEEGKGLGDDAMPPFIDKLTGEEVDLLVEYILSVQEK